MLRRQLTAMAVVSLLCAIPAQAQLALTVAGGASVPMGDFGDYASTGWIGSIGLMTDVGQKGLGIGALWFYGDNSTSDIEGDKTSLTGFLGNLRFRFGDATRPGVFVLGSAGYLDRKYKSELVSALEGSDNGFLYGGGVGIDLPRGRMTWYMQASWLSADIGDSSLQFSPITVGVAIGLGGRRK